MHQHGRGNFKQKNLGFYESVVNFTFENKQDDWSNLWFNSRISNTHDQIHICIWGKPETFLKVEVITSYVVSTCLRSTNGFLAIFEEKMT